MRMRYRDIDQARGAGRRWRARAAKTLYIALGARPHGIARAYVHIYYNNSIVHVKLAWGWPAGRTCQARAKAQIRCVNRYRSLEIASFCGGIFSIFTEAFRKLTRVS